MKFLSMIRHAKSSWKHENLTDFERPLNKRGEQDAPIMGKRLLENKFLPDLIISSPAIRAKTTAVIIAKEIGYDTAKIKLDSSIYEANLRDLLALIVNLRSDLNNVVIVGHNPGLTNLNNYLTTDYIDNIPTCGIAFLKLSLPNWAEVQRSTASLLKFDYPKRKVD